ncbi:hypothetical protein T03_6142 [Trichinella britovi]|uniref:Uncharacterized protein n=1 Tax=Trichinella britovi TaxID=45882 RepID=A0A0V1CU28_TRIBR|nr:hypothetical protein T03_6142 [Trichinella britovi]
MPPGKYLSSPDSFYHICGSFLVKNKRQKITDFVKKAYFAYFGIKLGYQDKSWAPHIKVRGYNAKNRKCMSYPNLPSAIRTVPQGPDVPIPSPPDSMGAVVLSDEESS